MRLSKQALASSADHMEGRYIPLLEEHDLLRPLGRVLGGHVRQREDGEWELTAQAEILESGDAHIEPSGGREFKVSAPSTKALHLLLGDQFLLDPITQPLVREAEALLALPAEIEARRSLDGEDFVKLVAALAVGESVKGFFNQLGADGYFKLVSLVSRLLTVRPGDARRRRLYLDLFFEREGVEVILIQANQTPEAIDGMLSRGLEEIDRILPALIRSQLGIRRVVAEYDDSGVHIAYILGADCFPRTVREAEYS